MTSFGEQIERGEIVTVSNFNRGKTGDKQEMCLQLDTWHHRLKLAEITFKYRVRTAQ